MKDIKKDNETDIKYDDISEESFLIFTSGLWHMVFQGMHSSLSMEAALAVAADHVTSPWGNFSMRDNSYEPRNNSWNNSVSYPYSTLTSYPYGQFYNAINGSLIVISYLDAGLKVKGGTANDMIRAYAKFNIGVAYGNLALMYDKSFIVDEKKPVSQAFSAALKYQDVAAVSIRYLNEAIALSSGNFTIPAGWLGTRFEYTNSDFKKLCNTMSAKILANMPRNQTELYATDWAKVKTYADAGITSDFTILMDGTIKWEFELANQLTNSVLSRVDMYVVNMMDPANQPNHWDDSATFSPPPKSLNPPDKRLLTDFEYLESNDFPAVRGYYHFSNYRFSRYDEQNLEMRSQKPDVMKSENDMLKAEARIYGIAPDLAGAAAIINAGTRVTRGQMRPVAAIKADLIAAIHHERSVEMFATGTGIQFFAMRKLNLLQKGTPLHFPLPAQILESLNAPLPYYTFGTTAKADGINTSNAGWR